MAGISFQFKQDGAVSILNVSGSIDAHNAPEFDKKMKEVLAKSKKIVLEVSQLDYIATAGLGVLMASFNEAISGGGNIVLAGMSDKIKKVFDTMGFSKVLKLFPSLAQAKSFF